MRKQDVIDELASLYDSIENTVDEMNKTEKKKELYQLIIALMRDLTNTHNQLEKYLTHD